MHFSPNHFFHWSWCQSVFLLDRSNSAKIANAYPSYSLERLILYFFFPGIHSVQSSMSSYNHLSLESTSLELRLILYLFSIQYLSITSTSVWKALLLACVNVTEAGWFVLSFITNRSRTDYFQGQLYMFQQPFVPEFQWLIKKGNLILFCLFVSVICFCFFFCARRSK